MVAYWIWCVRRSQRWGWQQRREMKFEGFGTQSIRFGQNLVMGVMRVWEIRVKAPTWLTVTMTLFTNGRFLRFLITPPLLPRFRRSLQTRKSLSTRLYTTPSSRNELSLSTKTSSTPLLEQMEPKLSLTFTCTVSDCGERSTHQFTKRAYQKGVVLVQCPGCKNRYVIF